MRILTILNWLNLGGIELMTLRAIPWLQEQGIHVDFCCTGPPGVLDAEFKELGCRIWRLPKSANCYATARYLERQLRRAHYAVVHSDFGYTSGGFALGAARRRVPIVVSFHSAQPLSLYGWRDRPLLGRVRARWLAWHRRLMLAHATAFVGHSRANLDAFDPQWRREPRKYRIINNGVDPPARRYSRKAARAALSLGDAPVLLHVGTFRLEKNHHGLLEIFRRIRRRLPHATLVLVGAGPLREDIEKAVAHLGLARHVRLEGAQRNVWPYYAAADAFVFPSITEGFGNALVESQVAGLPIVASDIQAHRESVAPPQQRFLFRLAQYDDAADLILAQIEAARDNSNPWVTASAAYVQTRFSTKQFACQLGQLYRDIAA